MIRTACAALAAVLAGVPPSPAASGPPLGVTYPPSPTVTHFSRIRVAGSSDPSARVTIAGTPSRVYPTGAFVGLVPLRPGDNAIEVTAELGGKKTRRTIHVECRGPVLTSPRSPACIDRAMALPDADLALQPGDELHLQVKGSPGMRASWSLGPVAREAPMAEAPPLKRDDGTEIRGIYRASYTVKEGDSVRRGRVRFTLAAPGGKRVGARSPGRVTLSPRAEPARGGVGAEGAPASAEPGGNKEWDLPPGARVTICGESGDSFRVRLSNAERWWTPKRCVARVKGEGGWPPSTAGPPSVEERKGGADVLLAVSGAPAWRVRGGKDARELRIDIFGVEPVRERMTARGAGPVELFEIPETETDILVARLLFRGGAPWGYSAERTKAGLSLRVKAAPGRPTVVIDPGHGGDQPGAVSPTGAKEKEINLAVAREAASFLRERGVRTVMTREDDRTLSLAGRVEKARAAGADIFVSVHHDSCPGCCDPLSRRGASVYCATSPSSGLAASLLRSLAGADTRGVRRRGFAVVAPTDYLAVLAECGYLSHPEDEERILAPGYARETGRRIAAGILDFMRESGS